MASSARKLKGIGIKNNRAWLRVVFGFAVFFAVGLCAFSWVFYAKDYKNEYMLRYGVEVQAVIYKAEHFVDTTTWSDGSVSMHQGWKTYYIYTDNETNKVYSGEARTYHGTGREEEAKSTVNSFITITIDPNCTDAVPYAKEEMAKPAYSLHLSLAIIATVALALCLWIWLYRGFYITALNRKMLKQIGITATRVTMSGGRVGFEELDIMEQANGFASRTNTAKLMQGEVVGSYGLFIKHIKVRYTDENGVIKCKLAKSLFTVHEAKFLLNKRIINIVPYKNIFGIFEEMPIEKQTKEKRYL